MRLAFLMVGLLGLLTLTVQPAAACDQEKLRADAKWCFDRPSEDGYVDLVVGSCKQDAKTTRDGFRSCQHDGLVRDNYDSCIPGIQVIAVRSVGKLLNIYKPGQCGSQDNVGFN